MLWQMSGGIHPVFIATGAIPARNIVQAGLGRDNSDGRFYNILLHFLIGLGFVSKLAAFGFCLTVLVNSWFGTSRSCVKRVHD